MNKLTKKLFTKVADLAQTPSVITKVADKLLNGLVPHEDASAAEDCQTILCSGCFGSGSSRVRYCTRYCCQRVLGVTVLCYSRPVRIAC